jgi:hypothetical protein
MLRVMASFGFGVLRHRRYLTRYHDGRHKLRQCAG